MPSNIVNQFASNIVKYGPETLLPAVVFVYLGFLMLRMKSNVSCSAQALNMLYSRMTLCKNTFSCEGWPRKSSTAKGQGKFNLCVWYCLIVNDTYLTLWLWLISFFFSHQTSWAGMASCRKFLRFESSWYFSNFCAAEPLSCVTLKYA